MPPPLALTTIYLHLPYLHQLRHPIHRIVIVHRRQHQQTSTPQSFIVDNINRHQLRRSREIIALLEV
jgi:hypothetical protein